MLTIRSNILQNALYGIIILFLGYETAILILNEQTFIFLFIGAALFLLYLIKVKGFSLYLLTFVAFIYLEFATMQEGGIGGRSYQFYLSLIIIFFFLFEYFRNRSGFHVPFNAKNNLFILAFFFFSLMAMFLSVNPERSLKNVTLLLQLPFYFICAELFYRKKKFLGRMGSLMTIMGVAIAIFYLLNYFYFGLTEGYFTALRKDMIEYPFLLVNTNSIAYALLVCMQFPLYKLVNKMRKGQKIGLVVFLLVMILAVLATYSRTGSALLVISFLFFFIRKRISRSMSIFVVLGAIFTVLALYFIFGSVFYENYLNRFETNSILTEHEIHRGATWKIAMEEFFQHPLFGVGPDVLIWELHQTHSLTHNTYFNILAERGIFSFISYIFILIYFFRISRKLEIKGQTEHQYLFMALSAVLMIHYLFGLTGDFPDSKFLWLIFSILTSEQCRIMNHKGCNA